MSDSDRPAGPTASVIIPAHDEEASIAATLHALTASAGDGELEVVVVCNGCTDRTAERARAAPGVKVQEIAEPSKIAALRAGDRQARAFPRVYLDADVLITTEAVRALAAALQQGDALVAGIPGSYVVDGASPLVRSYYAFRQQLPVFAEGIIGAGVYALSEQGRARFGDWPEVLGDDQFIYRLFEPFERTTVRGHQTIVRPVTDLRSIVARGVRVRRGNRQLTSGQAGARTTVPPRAGLGRAFRAAVRSPRRLAAAGCFVAVTGLVRVAERFGRGGDWGAPSSQGRSVTAVERVGVAAVSYNSAEDLPGFLASLDLGDQSSDVAVVVVDNASSDASTSIARSFPGVAVVGRGSNDGYAAGLNTAFEYLSNVDAVLVANPDVRLEPSTIRELAAALRAPGTGVAVPRLLDLDGRTQPSLRRDPSIKRALAEALLGGARAARLGWSEVVAVDQRYRRPGTVDWASGALLLVSSRCLRDVGPWDESFFLYSEETDFLLRARDAGWQIRFAPDAVARHRGGDAHRNPELWRLLASNRVRLFARRHGRASATLFWLAVALNELLRCRATTHRRALAGLVRDRRRLVRGGAASHPADRGVRGAP